MMLPHCSAGRVASIYKVWWCRKNISTKELRKHINRWQRTLDFVITMLCYLGETRKLAVGAWSCMSYSVSCLVTCAAWAQRASIGHRARGNRSLRCHQTFWHTVMTITFSVVGSLGTERQPLGSGQHAQGAVRRVQEPHNHCWKCQGWSYEVSSAHAYR